MLPSSAASSTLWSRGRIRMKAALEGVNLRVSLAFWLFGEELMREADDRTDRYRSHQQHLLRNHPLSSPRSCRRDNPQRHSTSCFDRAWPSDQAGSAIYHTSRAIFHAHHLLRRVLDLGNADCSAISFWRRCQKRGSQDSWHCAGKYQLRGRRGQLLGSDALLWDAESGRLGQWDRWSWAHRSWFLRARNKHVWIQRTYIDTTIPPRTS